MFVCIASHKSAEPNTLVVMMDFADRLSRVRADALHDLVIGAYRYMTASMGKPRGRRRRDS